MNIALISGVIITIERPQGYKQSGKLLLQRGGPRERRKNSTVHMVELNEIRVPKFATQYMLDLEEGMYIEVSGRVQGIIKEMPTGEAIFVQEILATHIQKTGLKEEHSEGAGGELPRQVEDEPDEMEI